MMLKIKNIAFIFAFLMIGLSQDSFDFNQSSQQAFYFIESAQIGEVQLDNEDMVGLFCNGLCVGSSFWQGPWTEIPAMGDDGSEWTEGYCLQGDFPTFKIFDSSENSYLIALPSNIIPALGGDYEGWGSELFFNLNNLDVMLDCNGTPNGNAFLDECGVCSGGNTGVEPNGDFDCNGDCFGEAFVDDCNVCSGGNTGNEPNYLQDCFGQCFGTAFIDDCNVCVIDGSEPDANKDCNGDCFGEAFIDDCDDCVGGNTGFIENYSQDCEGICFGDAVIDDCGVCSGGNTGIDPNSDIDCNNDCFGYAFLDDCGVCSSGNSNHIPNSDIDCNGICFGDAVIDNCDVCVGGETGIEPCLEDCAGIINGEAVIDSCGYCVGGTTGLEYEYAKDCSGICDGDALIDDCGICSGGSTEHDQNSDKDCNDDCFGGAIIDDCGICSGGETGIPINADVDACGICFGENINEDGIVIGPEVDCNGECFGISIIDDCGICSGGETGIPINADVDACGICFGENIEENGVIIGPDVDCIGVCFGDAFIDDCNVCSGGSSEHIANSDQDICGVCFGENIDENGLIIGPNADCAGVCFGDAFIDDCNVCSNGTTNHIPNSDLDCNNICFGEAIIDWCGECTGGDTGLGFNQSLDACGVCFGQNIDEDGLIIGPDADCAGVCFGQAFLDDCDVCSGGTSGHIGNSDQDVCGVCFGENIDEDGAIIGPDVDCFGDCFGEAFIDNCNTCVISGSDPDANKDCNDDCFGEAMIDYCGTCSGGQTGITPGFDDIGCGCFELAPEIYYFDIDNDGLGYGEGIEFCFSELETGWVDNNDDMEPYCSTNDTDDCEICGGGNIDLDCFGICFGGAELDECDECNGDNSSCNTPVAMQQSLSIFEDDSLVSILDVYDPTDDPLTIFITLGPSNGTLTMNGLDFIYIPNNNYVGSDLFYYVAFDGLFSTQPIRVDIDVIEVNDEPQSVSLNVSTNEDQEVIITIIGSDVESNNVEFEITQLPQNGNLSSILRSLGTVEYTPNENFNGTDSFLYRVFDGELYSEESSVVIDVLPINDPPFLIGEWFSINEDDEIILPINFGDVDGDILNIEILAGPFNGIVEIIDSDVIYTPEENYIGHDVILLQAVETFTTELYYSYPAAINIVINEVNDPPVAYDGEYVVNEDEFINIELLGADPEGDDIFYFIDSEPINGMLSGPLPNISYTPNNDFDGSDSFTYFVKDAMFAVSNTATITININPINDPPITDRADFEDVIPSGYNFDLTPFINDVDNDNLSIEFLPSSGENGLCFLGGSITPMGNNVFHYENADPFEFDYILYKAKDEISESSYDLIYFSIPSGRDYGNRSTTVAYEQNINVTEKLASNISLIASNVFSPFPLDGNGIDYRIIDYPTFGQLDTSNMILSVSNEIGTEGAIVEFIGEYYCDNAGGSNDFIEDYFIYEIYNPTLDEWSEQGQINLTIYGVNDQPIISNINDQVINEDTSGIVTFYVSDPDGPIIDENISFYSNDNDNYSYSLIYDDALDVNEVSFMFEPIDDFFGDGIITIEITDGEIVSPIVQSFNISVLPINDPPFVPQLNDINMFEEETVAIPLNANDIDGDIDLIFSYQVLSNMDMISVVIEDSILVISGQENHFGTSTISLIASDGEASSNAMNFNINIENVNDIPIIENLSYSSSINEDEENFEIYLTPFDYDNDNISISVYNFNPDIIPDENIMIESSNAESGIERFISLDPADNKYGEFNIIVAVSDNNSPAINIEVPISILPINDPPQIINPGIVTIEEDKDGYIILQAYDLENDSISYEYSYNNFNLSVISNNNAIEIIPNQNYFGNDSLVVSVSDGQDVLEQVINVEVLSINDPPIIVSSPLITAYEDLLYLYQVEVFDVDDENFIYSLNDAPNDMTISESGLIEWVPNEAILTSGLFTVSIKDGPEDDALVDTQEINITVIPVNDPPEITSTPSLIATEDILYNYQIEIMDPDNDVFIYELLNQPENMNINSDGLLSWVPIEGVFSSGLVTLNVYDGSTENSLSDQQQFAIFVTPVNDSPAIVSTPDLIAFEDQLYTYQIIVSDPDDSQFEFELNSGPEGMIISEDGMVTWIAIEGVVSSGVVDLSVFDGGEDGSIAANQIFEINVESINDAPMIVSEPIINATEDILYTYQILVDDPDDNEFNYILFSYPIGMQIDELGIITWLPTEGVLSSGVVIVQVSDGGENFSSPDIQIFEINVQPVNDSPTIISIPITSALEDVEYLYQVIVSDPDDTEFTYQLLSYPSNMSINTNGLIEWVPLNGVLSSDAVIVSVQDGGEDSSLPAQQQFEINVTPINDPPSMESIPLDSLYAIEDVLWTYQVIANDPDDLELNYNLMNAPDGMEITEGGLISWLPLEGVLTSGNVELVVSDGLENQVTPINQFFEVIVTPVNDPPIIVDINPDLLNAMEDILWNYQIEVLDPDDDEWIYNIFIGPEGMTISETGMISWIPTEGILTSETIIIQVFDGGEDNVSEDWIDFIVSVTPVNDSPVIISNPPLTGQTNILYTYQVLVEDPDDTEFNFSIYGSPLGMEIDLNGNITWLPQEPGIYGDILLIVSDGGEDEAPPAMQEFSITIEITDEIISTYTVHSGNNLISFYGVPTQNSVASVLYPAGDIVEGIIGAAEAATLVDGEWVGSLSLIKETSGYWLKIIEDGPDWYEFSITSPPPNLDLSYTIYPGTNLVSYIGTDGLGISSAIPDEVEFNVDGMIGEGIAATQQAPFHWVGSLTQLEHRKGYWMKSTGEFEFSWNIMNNFIRDDIIEENYFDEDLFNFERSMNQAFYFVKSIDINENKIKIGDWLIAYCNDVIVGSREWNGIYTDIPVMGSDGHSGTTNYCIEGDTPVFKLYDKSDDKFFDIDVDFIPQWKNNEIYFINSLSIIYNIPEIYSLNKPYPNPFNPVTTIDFSIPEQGYLNLGIYDIKGQQVDILIDGFIDAGYHSIKWNGINVASGVYFIKMNSGQYHSIQKMILLK